ncbi:hypothetical protein ACJW8E_04465 [Plesiomonas shigelloides]|uniref:hypothetical protein n=1 Tax=Plesiomonas shigelloides TaxID=703 RepID=UPI00387F32D9
MKNLLILTIVALFVSSPALAKRGCCSHHGGVSHCGDNGYYICNDGKQSPSCTCDSSFSEPEQQTYVPNIKALFSQRSDSPFLPKILLAPANDKGDV